MGVVPQGDVGKMNACLLAARCSDAQADSCDAESPSTESPLLSGVVAAGWLTRVALMCVSRLYVCPLLNCICAEVTANNDTGQQCEIADKRSRQFGHVHVPVLSRVEAQEPRPTDHDEISHDEARRDSVAHGVRLCATTP